MVTKEPVRIDCACGKKGLLKHTIPMHESSKGHREWLEGMSPQPVELEEMDETLMAALSAARNGGSPFMVAKMVRSVYNRFQWPDEKHLGTVRDFLIEHNIPIIDLPPHCSPDDARQYTDRAIKELQVQGYGTERWEIK
jgi:hypothetical protein